jgi:hypothetical protein
LFHCANSVILMNMTIFHNSRIKLVVALLALSMYSCATGVSLTTVAGVDTGGKGLFETRGEASVTAGNKSFGLRTTLSGGGGYNAAGSAGYAMVMPGLGFELYSPGRIVADFFYAARFFPGAEGQPALHSLGGALTGLWKIARLGAENSALYLGPRLQVESILNTGDIQSRVWFSLGLCFTWITYDTTRGNWGM